jgi:outer membrane protein TolC
MSDTGAMIGSSPSVMPENMTDVMAGQSLRLAFRFSYPVWTGNRLEAMAEAGEHRAKAAGSERDEQELDVRLMATLAYRQSVLAAAMLEISDREVAALEEQVRVARGELAVGRLAEVDLLRQEAALSAARSRQAEGRGELEMALVDLRAMLAIDQDTPVVLSEGIAAPTVSDEARRLSDRALAKRPALAAADERILAAHSEIESAEGERKPQVYAHGAVRGDAMRGEMITGGWAAALSVSIPVSDGGMRKGDRDKARAMLAMSQEDRNQLLLTLDQQVRQALIGYRVASEQLGLAEDGVRSAEEAYRVTALKYRAGRTTVADLLDALRMRTEAYVMRVAAGYRAQTAADRLIRATGDPSVITESHPVPLTWEPVGVVADADGQVRLSLNHVDALDFLGWLAREGRTEVAVRCEPSGSRELSGVYRAESLIAAAGKALAEARIASEPTASGLAITQWP